jgi:hypothetical protein
MRRISVVLGVAGVMAATVALAAGTALARAETETIRTEEPFTETIDNPCTGEPILFEGTLHRTTHTTLNETGYHFVSRYNASDVTGTGLLTGDTYTAPGAGITVGSSLVNGQNTNTEEFFLVYASNGDSPNFILHFLIKTTTNDQQQMAVEVTTIGCTPEVETTHTHQ